MRLSRNHQRLFVTAMLSPAALVASASAQEEGIAGPTRVTFSVEYHGPIIGTVSPSGGLYSEGDLLQPSNLGVLGPVPAPFMLMDGGTLGLPNYTQCFGAGHGPGDGCGIEVDALSFGDDHLLRDVLGETYAIYFSVEERSVGHPQLTTAPSVLTESPGGDSSADVWVSLPLPLPPLSPSIIGQHVGLFDGDGQTNTQGFPGNYKSLGLSEPNRVGFGFPAFPFDEGDNLDAFDMGPSVDPLMQPVYFSVDGGLASGGAPGSNTAASFSFPQIVLAGDVLVRDPALGVRLYAEANQLGLGSLDDLDALILAENGTAGFQPSSTPYDWAGLPLLGAAPDMLLFSVRANSPIIGTLDSLQGIPIEPGDLLIPPPMQDLGLPPGIFISAESLGLETSRSGGIADDMDAADMDDEPFEDCQGNGVDDSVDIALGTSDDDNLNNIPDECEEPGTTFCVCTAGVAPCGNPDASAGCENSTGVGATLIGAGSSSVFEDDLDLVMAQMPANQFGLVFMGEAALGSPVTLGDGVRCVSPGTSSLYRFLPAFGSGAGGTATVGSIVDYSCGGSLPAAACIASGSTWYFQGWYRDPVGPCNQGSNLTNGLAVLFTP